MSFKLISWNAQGIAKLSAEFFVETLREQHDYDAAIFQEVGYWGTTTKLEVSGGDLYLVTPRVGGKKQMGLLDSLGELLDLITTAPSVAYPIVGVDAQTALPPPRADKERWIGDFPGPACHCDFKRPPAQTDYVLIPARDIWKVSTAREEVVASAQSDHSAIKLELTLGTRGRYVWNGGRAPMKGWTCLDNRFQRWSHNACYADRNPAPITHELMQTLRMLEARRRGTRDRVQRAIYGKDIIGIRRQIWAANRALQHGSHEAGNPRVRTPRRALPGPARIQLTSAAGEIEDDPLRIKELLGREYSNAFRASHGEGACRGLREAPGDVEAMKAPGVDGVVAEVLQKLNALGLIKKCGSKLTLRSPQYAYRKSQAMGVIFSMRMHVEKAREWNRPIFIMDGDIEAAFDRASHRSIEETLRRRAVPRPAVLAIVRELSASAVIKMGSIQTQPVLRTPGIRQGTPASTILFNLVLEDASEEFLDECWTHGQGFEFPGEATLHEAGLLHADNLWLFAGAAETLRLMAMAWRRVLRDRGWRIPPSGLTWGATALGREFGDYQARVEGGILTRAPRAEGFPCLGAVFDFDGTSWKDTQHRAARLLSLLRSQAVSAWTRLPLAAGREAARASYQSCLALWFGGSLCALQTQPTWNIDVNLRRLTWAGHLAR
ncbi:unnamed protein product [Prorocentrum cordatum]|uniref:Reverse transcriptase domain-containing protein n=1 Tax=Prorocentrum cordatum TaxID=2364126 RepID=A0ABN9XVW0_9DINO|nr:unnamed protein product [Polarella glacialis]